MIELQRVTNYNSIPFNHLIYFIVEVLVGHSYPLSKCTAWQAACYMCVAMKFKTISSTVNSSIVVVNVNIIIIIMNHAYFYLHCELKLICSMIIWNVAGIPVNHFPNKYQPSTDLLFDNLIRGAADFIASKLGEMRSMTRMKKKRDISNNHRTPNDEHNTIQTKLRKKQKR